MSCRPQIRPRSMTITDLPRLQSSYAVEIPAIPEPMTATSHSWTPSRTSASRATSISIQSDVLVIKRPPKQLRTFAIPAEFHVQSYAVRGARPSMRRSAAAFFGAWASLSLLK